MAGICNSLKGTMDNHACLQRIKTNDTRLPREEIRTKGDSRFKPEVKRKVKNSPEGVELRKAKFVKRSMRVFGGLPRDQDSIWSKQRRS